MDPSIATMRPIDVYQLSPLYQAMELGSFRRKLSYLKSQWAFQGAIPSTYQRSATTRKENTAARHMQDMETGASKVAVGKSDAEKAREKEEEKMKKMPWNDHQACKVIHQDSHPNGILYGLEYSDELAERVWAFYQTLKEFKYVSCNEFKRRLKDHLGKSASTQRRKAHADEAAIAHDRNLYPPRLYNSMGKLTLEQSGVKELLEADLEAGKFDQMTPKQLQTTNSVYMQFDLPRFTKAMRQVRCRKKLINWIEYKQSKEHADVSHTKEERRQMFAGLNLA